MRRSLSGPGLALVAALAAAGPAHAVSLREQQSNAAWKIQDRCAHDAFVKFPDYTPDGNAKRAAATRDCERKNHVLERAPTIAPPLKRIPDSAAE